MTIAMPVLLGNMGSSVLFGMSVITIREKKFRGKNILAMKPD